jgi:hypothetical protein
VPFIADRTRAIIRNTYLPADDHKALAISLTRIGLATGQADDDTAIPSCTLASSRRSRRSRGLFPIQRSNDRSTR